MQIVLASTSRYRAKQLHDIGLKFKAVAPPFDEDAFKTRSTHLNPRTLARELAYEKAMSVARTSRRTRDIVIIGADQLVSMDGLTLGKPENANNARVMLAKMQGRSHELITAVCVITRVRGKMRVQRSVDTVKIKMRRLTKAQIARYVRRDRPFDCAGSYRFEQGGLALVEKLKLRDPSSLIGLPIIDLVSMLARIKNLETFL